MADGSSRPRTDPSAIALVLFALLCATLGLVPLANVLTAGRAIGWWSGAVREWAVRGTVVVLVALGIAALLRHRLDAMLERARELLLLTPPIVFAALATILAAALTRYCFAGQPFTSDEMAQQFHARILLSGHLSIPAELHAEFFNTAPVLDRGHWFSQYPIGGPLLIALGLAAGAAWLVNPLFLGIATYNLYRFLAAWCDDVTARVTTLLFATSPMVLVMAASQMNHVPTLAFVTIALAALPRAHDWRHAATIGLALGAAAAIRPFDAALVGLVIGSFQLRRPRPALAVQTLAAALPIALLLWANARTTGSSLLFGYDALNGPAHRLGFHVDPTGAMHTPLRGVVLASGYLMRLDRFLFEWPIPAMLVVVAGTLGIVMTRRTSRLDLLLAGLATAFLLGYGAYWFDGFFAGPRFLFTALPAFVYFAARAPGLVPAKSSLMRRAALVIVPVCLVWSWLGPLGISSAAARVILYRDQRSKLKTDVDAQLQRAGLHDALVFVNEPWRGRLLARLRVLGVGQFEAERVVSTLDACALQMALDAGDTREHVLARARAAGTAQRVQGLAADQTIALVPGSTPTATCLREVEQDRAGSMPYALFLARQTVGSDGRVGGDVVFVRDLGERNELLRERFKDRVWYRYRPPAGLDDTAQVFVPYDCGLRTPDCGLTASGRF